MTALVTGGRPFVSVIIPVFNDPERLKVCLGALRNQSYPPDLYEILLVDNGSEKPVTALAASYPNVVCLSESSPGSYAARNAAIRKANGEIIAYTDADCVPAGDWLERAIEHLQALPQRTILAGRIDRTIADERPLSAIQSYDRTFFLRQEEYVRQAGWAVTANLFAPLDAFRSVGLFNANLRSGGDFEWTTRARKGGFTIRYADDVVVWHPTIETLPALLRKARRVAGAHVALQRQYRRSLVREIRGIARELYEVIPKCRRARRECQTALGTRRMALLMTVALVQLARAAERIRVMGGGHPRRR